MSINLFEYREAIPSNHRIGLPAEFVVNAGSRYDILILRTLTSTLNIYSIKKEKTIKNYENYITFPSHRLARKSTVPIRSYLSPFSFTDYIRFSNKYYGRNIIFYKNILQEVTYYFFYTSQNQNQSAFVNLYRTLEFMSYSFPLMHSSHFGNFIGTFENFKKYFAEAKGELGFFDAFVSRLFSGTPYLNLTSDFQFTHADPLIARNCYNSLRGLIDAANWIVADPVNFKLSIENKSLIKLFITIRNRYFHYAIGGQRNISNTELQDPDFFFENVNHIFLNWLAFIYATVMKESLDNALF